MNTTKPWDDSMKLLVQQSPDPPWLWFAMRDLLSDTWVIQEIKREGIEKGRAEGREEGLRNMLIRITTLRFPDLVVLAQKQAEQTKSPEQLQTMIDKLVLAMTDQEARDALIS